MNVARTDETPGEGWTPMPDLSGQPITLLDLADDSVLGRSLQRVLDSFDDPDGVISAFSSFVTSD